MKQVELVRSRAAKGMQSEILRFRIWLSGVEGNAAEVDKLRDKAGEMLLAMLIETVMIHLGVDNLLTTADDQSTGGALTVAGSATTGRHSRARKAARGKM